MISVVVCVANLLYGCSQTVLMWKKRKKTEAALLLILTLWITGYFLPATSPYWPTAQKTNSALYQPISDYVFNLLHIRAEGN